jgi:hypothetical protein
LRRVPVGYGVLGVLRICPHSFSEPRFLCKVGWLFALTPTDEKPWFSCVFDFYGLKPLSIST